MPTQIRINHQIPFGQKVEIVVGETALELAWLGDHWWGGSVEFRTGSDYHYRVVAGTEIVAEEGIPYRSAPPADAAGIKAGIVVDRWRSRDSARLSRSSALFSRALAARHIASGAQPSPPTTGVRFWLLEPWVAPGHRPAIVGSTGELGEWDSSRAIPLTASDFPQWEATVDVGTGGGEYKYVIVDAEGDVVRWEAGPNRLLPAGEISVIVDDEVRGLDPWRGAGVAVPVFSLRSDRDVGVGQFSDLPALGQWARSVGLGVLQLLPVNDTVLDHDWDDSYPYNPISVHALHPLYIDLDAISGHGITSEIEKARRDLNDAAEIDYVAVMDLKWRLLRLAYSNLEESLDADDQFAEFVDAEWEWLGPYSLWCLLRDRHGSGDPATWPADNEYSADRLVEVADHDHRDYPALRFYWFVQYHLHHQLNAAAAEVRSMGVALKGDLPIGVAPESVEVWTQPELFHVGTQTGAPPDAFAREGQNWGFPTYNWDQMAEDGFTWWRDRFVAFAAYVDVYRIDHVLGFFRIWEIPPGGYDGLVGHFRPSLPWSAAEVDAARGDLDIDQLLLPHPVTDLEERFGPHADEASEFFDAAGALLPRFRDQNEIVDELNGEGLDSPESLLRRLLDVAADVAIVAVPGGYAPAIAWEESTIYDAMTSESRELFDAMAVDFFHRRHQEMWEMQGRLTLPAVVGATDLLACGEDLGMVPDAVPRLMNDMGLLSLEIERMPKRLGEWIAEPSTAPYLSVVSPGTHDTSTLRQWWEEDPDLIGRYWKDALGQFGDPPPTASGEIIAAMLRRQLASPAMLCIIPVADLFGIDEDLRRDDIAAERINDPANRHNRWRYRMHLSLDELSAAEDFNASLSTLIAESGRRA